MPWEKLLREKKVRYELTQHEQAFSAQEVAAVEHVTGHKFAKTVVVTADGEVFMLVLPASRHVDFKKAADIVGKELKMASEERMKQLFPDVEIGAEPPFGSQYGMKTFVDQSLKGVDTIIFRAGTHDRTAKIRLTDYERVERPTYGSFAIEEF